MTSTPDFFIIGAPKCGTTSLASWLSEHPDIFMCNPKEPNFYAPDVSSSMAATSAEGYAALFRAAQPGQRLGEASTTYLRSAEAVPRFLQDNPLARIVVCLRNPVEMAPSVHAQLVKVGRETEKDFARAWALQDSRRAENTPRRLSHNPADLQYAEMCRLGHQVKALLSMAPRDQILFLLADDLRCDPREAYLRVLCHIAVHDDGRSNFPSMNERGIPRFIGLARMTHFFTEVKARLGIKRPMGLGRYVASANIRPPTEVEVAVSHVLREQMLNCFEEDVALLQSLIERDLSAWRTLDKSVSP